MSVDEPRRGDPPFKGDLNAVPGARAQSPLEPATLQLKTNLGKA
jgi:hypothetical protein